MTPACRLPAGRQGRQFFISYHQKDNKYDGWVIEFVDHLRREPEAIFKEEVSGTK